MSHAAMCRSFGFKNTTVLGWEEGRQLPDEAVSALDRLGCDLAWLFTGLRETPVEPDAPRAARPAEAVMAPREPAAVVMAPRELAVVGSAAADETQGARAGFFPPDAEAQFGRVTIPETTNLVRIIGDSMSPVLLAGQYAFIGPEYVGPFRRPRNGDIVVVEVEVRDEAARAADRHWEGVYCKRVVDGGNVWVFLSINVTGTAFSAAKSSCRLWPVEGVWFAGQGKPPV
ncbi:MAG: hypothetical protein LBU23_10440 [Planctomycetota bacterium]|jgi:phage repressor protein C with HTH and peptisase S24 domain|nr:hypothetical protein [Planctomycetota bacterium]